MAFFALRPLVLSVLALAGLASCASASAATSPNESDHAQAPKLTTQPALSPGFSLKQSDYAVRCMNGPVEATFALPDGWSAKLNRGKLRSQDFTATQPLRSGRSFTATFRTPTGQANTVHVRCLPNDFPKYRVAVSKPGAPRLTLVDLDYHYAVAFDAGGAPVWWYRHTGNPENPTMFSNGTFGIISIRNGQFDRFEVRSLTGHLLRALTPQGNVTSDSHDLQWLPNGNFVFGTHREVPFDTTRFGGPAGASLNTAQIQMVRPNGRLAWQWNAYPKIQPRETGRWWETILPLGQPFDVAHWNSVDVQGRYMLLSFRHYDAIYKVNRRTGRIVWKLGGVKTGKSLRIKGDPYGRYPFGGQHDARFMPDGSVTVFDNQSYFNQRKPRAVRYSINEKTRTATMIRQIVDPRFDFSLGFGSARVGKNGNWTICWGVAGKNAKLPGGTIATYDPQGHAFYRIFTPETTPYRANPVYSQKPTIGQIRRAMSIKARQS
jgi:hypothetical protein